MFPRFRGNNPPLFHNSHLFHQWFLRNLPFLTGRHITSQSDQMYLESSPFKHLVLTVNPCSARSLTPAYNLIHHLGYFDCFYPPLHYRTDFLGALPPFIVDLQFGPNLLFQNVSGSCLISVCFLVLPQQFCGSVKLCSPIISCWEETHCVFNGIIIFGYILYYQIIIFLCHFIKKDIYIYFNIKYLFEFNHQK